MKNLFIPLLIFAFTLSFNTSFAQKQCLFSRIFEEEGIPKMKIETDLGQLIKKSKKEEFQKAKVTIFDKSEEDMVTLSGRVRARGNIRKEVCRFPPIKIDFTKADLDSLGFKGKIDKLKFVFPCRDRSSDQEKLFKEFLLYDIYKIIDSNGINAKLIDVTFTESDEIKSEFRSVLIEDEMAYAHRTKAKIVETGKLRAGSLDRDLFLKMTFFQYMIANTDWSIRTFHNLEMVKYPWNITA